MIGVEREFRRRFESGVRCPRDERNEKKKRSCLLGTGEGQWGLCVLIMCCRSRIRAAATKRTRLSVRSRARNSWPTRRPSINTRSTTPRYSTFATWPWISRGVRVPPPTRSRRCRTDGVCATPRPSRVRPTDTNVSTYTYRDPWRPRLPRSHPPLMYPGIRPDVPEQVSCITRPVEWPNRFYLLYTLCLSIIRQP